MNRTRKPRALKVLKRTLRKNRDIPTPEPVPERAQPPALLTDAEKRHFELLVTRLEEIGIASKSFDMVIALTAKRLAEVEQLDEILATEGASYSRKGDNGETILRPHPAVSMRTTAMRHAQSLLKDLGLSPSSLASVRAPEKKTDGGEWSEF